MSKPEMTYSRASEILGLTTPKSVRAQAELARGILRSLTPGAPLRYHVACDVLIKAYEGSK